MSSLYNFQRTSGGDERNRTADPLLARQVLSQLSYTPDFGRLSLGSFPTTNDPPPTTNLVGLSGLEPPASRLSGVRSNQLSYTPTYKIKWRRGWDSNPRGLAP